MKKLTFYQSCVPDVGTDEVLCVELSQTVGEAGPDAAYARSTGTLYLQPVGPRLRLEPDEIVGCSPSPGSTTTPDEVLPHVALRRRTLPWERQGPREGDPWMMILVLRDDERFHSGWTYGDLPAWVIHDRDASKLKSKTSSAQLRSVLAEEGDDEPLTWLDIREGLLKTLLGDPSQLALRSFMLRLPPDDTQGMEDEDGDVAMVVSPRLPWAGGVGQEPVQHTALLVSLERRDDLPWPPGRGTGSDDTRHQLVVLHKWSFTPSQDGDFEYVVKAIRHHPQGGVLRYGWLPDEPASAAHPEGREQRPLLDERGALELLDEENKSCLYRGPLRASPVPERSPRIALRGDLAELDAMDDARPDISEVTAFELGRLLMLSDPAALAALDEVRRVIDPDPSLIDVDALHASLRRFRTRQELDWTGLITQDALGALPRISPHGAAPISATQRAQLSEAATANPSPPSVDLARSDALSQLAAGFSGLRQRT